MMRLLTLVILTVFCVAVAHATAYLAAAPLTTAAPAVRGTDVKATLTGEVLQFGLARPGDTVRDGDPLVYVRTLVGRGVAARAPRDGVVAEVLVRPGEMIAAKGAVVVRLAPR